MTTPLELKPAIAEKAHPHRWRIDEPNGPESLGRCQLCGATKSFRNALEEDISPFGSGPLLAA